MECSSCHRQISVTAGTIFEETRKPLLMWFRAMWWVTNQKTGVSALGLKRLLGLGSYQTAWAWLHKLRRAMARPGRERLSGRVEIDETYLGGHETERGGGARGRGTTRKTLVAIAAEEAGAGIGRIRMQRITGATTVNLERFIRASIEPGSVMRSCRGSTVLPPCLSAGSWGPTKVRSATNISTTTSMNSRSGSIVENLRAAESSSTDSSSKPPQ